MDTKVVHSPRPRFYQWDNLKFVLILLVVFGHVIHTYVESSELAQIIYIYIGFFHMPAFLFISGMFSKRVIQNKDYRKCFEFFVLYIFSKLCIFIVQCYTRDQYELSLLNEASVPWYAFALMIFVFTTILLQNVQPTYLFIFSIVMGCIVGYDTDFNDYFVSSRSIVFYPFFLAGYYMDRQKISNFLAKWYFRIAAILLHIGLLLYLFNVSNAVKLWKPLVNGREHLDQIGSDYFSARLLYYFLAFALIFSVISLAPRRKLPISAMGGRSVQTYVLHRGPIYLFYYYFPAENLLKHWGDIKIQLFSLLLSVVLTLFLSLKLWEKPLQKILKPTWVTQKPSQ